MLQHMKFGLTRPLLLMVFAAGLLLACAAWGDQKSDFADAGKSLAKHLAKAGITSVAVADFLREDGAPLAVGRYFAQELTESLKNRDPHLAVVDPWRLTIALADEPISPKDLLTPENVQKLHTWVNVDAVVIGTVETAPDHYAVKLVTRSTRDGNIVLTQNNFIRRPCYTDVLMLRDPTATEQRIATAGQNGVSNPVCVECQMPAYPEGESKPKAKGTVSLEVIVDEDGRVLKASVVQSSDPALADRAAEAVRKWKFKPALNKNGKPVVVIVPVEVTFRVY